MNDQPPYTEPVNKRRAMVVIFGFYVVGATLVWILVIQRQGYIGKNILLEILQFVVLVSLSGLGALTLIWAMGEFFRLLALPFKAKNIDKLKRAPSRLFQRADGELLEIVDDTQQPLDQHKDKRS